MISLNISGKKTYHYLALFEMDHILNQQDADTINTIDNYFDVFYVAANHYALRSKNDTSF